jgi:sec-independent protein translocase protein TatA
MGPIGVQEMMLIFLVALVLFGPKKLPELGRLLGKGLTEYRRAKSELKSTFETHLRELEREANVDSALKSVTSPYSSPTSISSTSYDEYGHEPSYSSPAPYPEAASSEPAVSSPSSTASVTATQDAEAYRETPSTTAVSPVAGTVPRSNGVHPPAAEPPSTTTTAPEGHSA